MGRDNELFEDMGLGQRNPKRLRVEDVFVSLRIGEESGDSREGASVLFQGMGAEERQILLLKQTALKGATPAGFSGFHHR